MLLIPAHCLAIATIIGEASSEPYEGQVAVGRVIRNRMRLKYSSDGTVAGTVLRPLQFSLWNASEWGRIRVCKLDIDLSPEVAMAKKAWIESEDYIPLYQSIVLYHTIDIHPTWADRVTLITSIGRHHFYSDPNAAK